LAPYLNDNNEFVNVPANGKVPAIAYFGIGLRGCYNITSTDEVGPLSQPFAPKATEMDLYTPIPIRCVPLENDLTGDDVKPYRMRTIQEKDGNLYACYWLKKIEFEESINIKTINAQGESSDFDFNNIGANMTPTPSMPSTPEIVTGSTKVIVSANVKCIIKGSEVLEAINVLYDGDLRRARISEWGIYTGADKEGCVKPPYQDENGNTVSSDIYTEAIYVQLAAKRCTTGVDMSNSSSEQHEILTIQNGNLLLID
jgi:hypothetical protein